MALTQADIAAQLIAAARIIDPGFSGEIGTPERKIIDTVAEALAQAQTDLLGIQGSLDITALSGNNLDAFLSLFGFGRQQAQAASGFVTFSIPTPATSDIRIPANQQVVAHNVVVASNTVSDVTYYTTADVILSQGTTSVDAPIRATLTGSQGDVNAGAITDFIGSPPFGVSSVTNMGAITGGQNLETDPEFKIRFQNTVFRNLSGTEDQYLANALSTPYTTRANVVGPVSTYKEYLQVPSSDDATAYDINGDGAAEGGNGAAGQYTTALSSVPYSKHIYDTNPVFVSSGQFSNTQTVYFYIEDIDFTFNTTLSAKNRGDTYRMYNLAPVSGVTPDPIGPNPSTDPQAETAPNLTFLNVYTGTDATVTAVRPNDVVLFEHQYMSNVSRNDWTRNITNAVDVFIDGQNPINATMIITVPKTSSAFVNDPTSVFYHDNYRRVGLSEHRPILGNILTPVYYQPIVDLPDTIQVAVSNNSYTYIKGVHYWAVEDVSQIGDSVRSRSGIEWSTNVGGAKSTDPPGGPYTGPIVSSLPAGTSINITNYTYDSNVSTVQALCETNKQITTDILVHQATTRYFKPDVSIMYEPGVSLQDINSRIQNALGRFFSELPFGAPIQLSDIIQVVHNTAGVDNVRWSADTPVPSIITRLYETDINGRPLTNATIDRVTTGTGSTSEVQQLVISGSPNGGTYKLTYNGNTTSAIPYNSGSGYVQTALNAVPVSANVTITGLGTPESPFIIAFTGSGSKSLITVDATALVGGPNLINEDFFLNDNELAAIPLAAYTPPSGIADTIAGLIVRVRSASTWTKT